MTEAIVRELRDAATGAVIAACLIFITWFWIHLYVPNCKPECTCETGVEG